MGCWALCLENAIHKVLGALGLLKKVGHHVMRQTEAFAEYPG
jgi:hypothetical protein